MGNRYDKSSEFYCKRHKVIHSDHQLHKGTATLEEIKQYRGQNKSSFKVALPAMGADRKTSIAFLLADKSWRSPFEYETALKFVEIALRFTKPDSCGLLRFDRKACIQEIHKTLGTGMFAAANYLTELRKAAREGMTVEKYFKLGRPFAASKKGAKVLA